MTQRPLPVLVVDDERHARRNVLRFLREDARFAAVGEATDGVEALEMIDRLAPAVLVLDIQMPGLDGFEVLAAIGEPLPFAVVFSTAFDAHALRAFEVHAVDYLLKPYDAQRLLRAMDKAYAQCLHRTPDGPHPHPAITSLVRAGVPSPAPRLTVKSVDGTWLVMRVSEISRLAAANKHTRIHHQGTEHMVRLSLGELAERLGQRFVRIHRSEYVNLDSVRSVAPWSHGDALITMLDGSTLVLTRTYRAAFLEQLGTRTLR